MNVSIQRLPESDGIPLPTYMTAGAAGADLCAAFVQDMIHLDPGERALIPTGFAIALPEGYEAQIRPRSGLSLRTGLSVIQGTIDWDYAGPVGIIAINLSDAPISVKRGDRIAQMIIAPVARAEFDLVEALPRTERGENGFGSTGKSCPT